MKTIDLDYYGKDFKNTIDKAAKKLKQIDYIREETLQLNIKEKKVNDYYTKLIDIFIETITYASNFSTSKTLSRELTAYSNLVYAIERTANERGLGTLAYSSKKLSFDMRIQLHDLVLEQKVYLKNFKRNLDKKSLEKFEKLFQGRIIDESVRMRNILLNSIEKKLIILKINKLVGYGGIVHYLNNYKISRDNSYIEKINNKYAQLKKLLDDYRNIKHISLKEKKLLKDVEKEFSSYIKNIHDINRQIIESATLSTLIDTNFFVDDSSYWFTTMTEKIFILEKVSNSLIKQMLFDTNETSTDAKNAMIFYTVLCLLIFIAVLFIGRNISINIVNSVDALLKGIDRFFKFVNKKSKDIELIKIQSNDEIGAISKIINEKITISKKILDEDIIERAKQLELEVKRKTKDLKTKNEEYEILLDRFNNHAIATRTDTLGMITFVTDKFCKMSGYKKKN